MDTLRMGLHCRLATILLLAVVVTLPAQAGESGFPIPELRSEITKLLFYESGAGVPPKAQRSYQTSFDANWARYINWELNIDHASPQQRLDFQVYAIYYKPDNSELTRHNISSYAEPGWTSSNHSSGYGDENPGLWTPGRYRVDIDINGNTVATGYFAVTDGLEVPPVHAGPPPEIPADLGELDG